MVDGKFRIVKVAGTTQPHSLAVSLQKLLNEDGDRAVLIHAVGHGAVGQAIKGCVILNTKTVNAGIYYTLFPSLVDVIDEATGNEITVTRLKLVPVDAG